MYSPMFTHLIWSWFLRKFPRITNITNINSGIPGGRISSDEDPRCTQKPIYTPMFTHHIWSWLFYPTRHRYRPHWMKMYGPLGYWFESHGTKITRSECVQNGTHLGQMMCTSDRWCVWRVWSVWSVWSIPTWWCRYFRAVQFLMCRQECSFYVVGWESHNMHHLGQRSFPILYTRSSSCCRVGAV